MALLARPKPLRASDKAWASGIVQLLVAGSTPRPRLDWARLGDGEQRELFELCAQLGSADFDGTDWTRLGKTEARRFWRLVAKASALPLDHFATRQKEASMAATMARQEADARRLQVTRPQLTALLSTLYGELVEEELYIDDVSALVAVLVQFGAEKPLTASSRFEGEGVELELVIDSNLGFLGVAAGAGGLDNWRDRLPFLHDEHWIVLNRQGPTWRIALGDRLLAALGGPLDPPEVTP